MYTSPLRDRKTEAFQKLLYPGTKTTMTILNKLVLTI